MHLYLRTQKVYQFETDFLLLCVLPLFVLCSNLNVSVLHCV